MAVRGLALVTGASGGIGRELALLLLRRGWDLIVTGRRPEPLHAIRAGAPERTVHVVVGDLASRRGVDDLLGYINTHGLFVEILINNAGFGRIGPFIDLTEAEQLDMIGLNVSSVLRLTHALAREMARRGHGYLLNVASTAAFSPGPIMSVYYATKAFDYSFSMALGEELGRRGIVVTTLCPGPTRSGFDRASGLSGDRQHGGRLMGPDRVAAAGLDGLFAGRRLVVPGFLNKALAILARILPHGILLKTVFRFNSAK